MAGFIELNSEQFVDVLSSKAPVRHDAGRATFYFTSSEAGDYYFILTAAGSAAPADSPQ